MIATQESESSTYPLKMLTSLEDSQKNFGQAQNFFVTPTGFREEARDF